MKKILITGGCGFIGSNLVRMLINEKSCSVVNVDKVTYAGNPDSLKDVTGSAQYHFEQVDLCDAQALKEVFAKHEPSSVIHLAAESHVDRSIDGPGAFVQTNVVGTFNLLQCALAYWRGLGEEGSVGPNRSSFRLVHVSTDEVYGSLGATDGRFVESTAYDPHSPYSASKAASDHLVRSWWHTYGFPAIVAHSSNAYGPYQFPEKLIPLVILKCLSGDAIPVYGSGENIRDWIYVLDLCEALYRINEDGAAGETYNVGANNEIRNIDLVRQVCSLMSELVPQDAEYEQLITFVADRPGHDLWYAIDSAKICGELEWQPHVQWPEGLRRTVGWYLENRAWRETILNQNYGLERLGGTA